MFSTLNIFKMRQLILPTIAFFLLITTIYYYGFQTNHSKSLPQKQYPLLKPEKKQDIIGTYTSDDKQCFKELILDSTYTYTYRFQHNKQLISLKGSWELSLKNNDQHIVLHHPFPKQNVVIPALLATDECLLKVKPTGLVNQQSKEMYHQTTVATTALSFEEQ